MLVLLQGARAQSPAPVPTQATPPNVSSGLGMTPTAILAGRGKITYPPDVSGAVEVEVAFRNLPKPDGWDRDLHSVCEARKQTLALAVDHLKQLLNPNDPDSYPATRPQQTGPLPLSPAHLLTYHSNT